MSRRRDGDDDEGEVVRQGVTPPLSYPVLWCLKETFRGVSCLVWYVPPIPLIVPWLSHHAKAWGTVVMGSWRRTPCRLGVMLHRRFRDSLLLLLGFAICGRVLLSRGSLFEGVGTCFATALGELVACAVVGSGVWFLSAVSLRIRMCSSIVLISLLYLS